MNIRLLADSWLAVALALVIIFLAGLSEGLGSQGVILLINRIPPLRFMLNLALNALLFVLSALLWVALLWLVATLAFHDTGSLRQAFVTISAAYVPLLLGALTLLPYFGPLISQCLHLWSLLAALAAIRTTFHLPLGQSILCALLGWLLLQALRWTVRTPAAVLSRQLWQFSTGHTVQLSLADLPQVIPGYAPHERT